ncbi:MAG: hypothetical protein ABSG15_11835 [FCB group bacterium]
MKTKSILYVFLFSFLYINLSIINAQVSINPMYIVIDKETKNGTVDVLNPSNEVREFNLDFKFGYPKYDSLGKWEMKYDDSVMAKKYSLVPYIRMFPKKLVIPPKETQTVRLILKDLPSGGDLTYWTRVIVSSEPVTPQIDTTTYSKADSGKIRTRIILKTQIIALILYHQGNVTSAVDFNIYRTFTDSLGLHLICKIEKGGTSPFLGAYILKVYDSNNNLLIEKKDRVTIYENSNVEYLMEASSLKKGKLKVELTINNEKDEIPEDLRLPFKPVTKVFELEY